MRSLFTFFIAVFLFGCHTKTKEERELEKIYAEYEKIKDKLPPYTGKPLEIVMQETPTPVETSKKINSDSLFLINCTKDSLFSIYLKNRTNFKSPVELKKYLLANSTKFKNKKFAIKASGDAPYERIQKIIEVLQDTLLSIKTFSLVTDMEKFD